jgi:mono/diheme cytochrome c family protein
MSNARGRICSLPLFTLAILAWPFLLAAGTSGRAAQNAKSGAAADQDSRYAPLLQVPEKARLRTNPLAADPKAPLAGHKLFEEHCAECHGKDAGGGHKGPSLRGPEVQEATPGALFWILSNGVVRGGMPDWSKLPEPERWQVVTFLKSLGGHPESAASTPAR